MMIMTCLTGCKYSPKLHQLIQDRFNHLLDTRSAKEFENDFNRVEKTDDLKAKELDERSERKKEENEENPIEGDNTEQNEEQPAARSVLGTGNHREASASDRKNPAAISQGTSSGSNGSVTAGSATGNGNGSAGSGGSGGNGTGGSGSGNGGTAEGGEGTGETGDNGTTIVPGTGGTRQIVDERGEYVEIPEEVSSVACSGQSAVLFCAVGGEQLIQASSESFIANTMLDESVRARIQPLWRGNGTGAISDADFAALMSLQPEVLVELSGTSSFSSDQIGQLQANGTSYVVLPALDSIDNIKKAVGLAGQMTGDRSGSGGVNGEALASQYSGYVDNLINSTQSRVRSTGSGSGFRDLGVSSDGYYNGKYSLYIQGWDESASYSISNSYFSGMGVAWSGNNKSSAGQLMTSLMSIGGVYNTIQKIEQTSAKNLYIVPLSWWQSTMTLEVNGFQISLEGNNGHVARKKLLEHQNQMLGSGTFPAVIAGNRSVAENLPSNPLWQPGSEVNFDGNFQVNGFLSADNSTGIASSIVGTFPVFISPSGLGTWTGGSPESVLESAWIASNFFGAYSDQELAQIIGDFYSQFYRIPLDSTQISGVLSGSIGG